MNYGNISAIISGLITQERGHLGLEQTEKCSIRHRRRKFSWPQSLWLQFSKGPAELRDDASRESALRSMVSRYRYEDDGSGYFFVYNQTKNVVLGPSPDNQGQDLGGFKDRNGIYLVRELYNLARQGGARICLE